MRSLARTFVRITVAGMLAATGGAVAATPVAAAPAPPPHAVGGFVAPAGRAAAGSQAGASAFAVPPESVDLRPYAPAVGDQGQISSCVAWSIAHSVMGYLANRAGSRGAPYAPLYLYMRAVGSGAPSNGLVPEYALAEAASNGVDTEADYFQGSYGWQTPPTKTEIANAANYRISGWNRLWLGDHQGNSAQLAVEQALAAGNPVLIGMPVYLDFEYLNSSALYNTLSGRSLGGHMVTIFAYDAQGVWIRNQWGTNWGSHGDAHLSWAFVNTLVMAAYTVSGLNAPTEPKIAPPAGLALSPATASTAGGTEVTITGTGLTGATAVRFGDTAAQFRTTQVNGATRLVAVAPPHTAGVVDVKVTNAGGTSAVATATKFTYVVPAPAITALSPNTGSTITATSVVVTGTNLAGLTKVTAGGTSVAFTRLSETQVRITLPVHAAGTVPIVVTTPGGSSPGAGFTYVVPAPAITALSPNTGPTITATSVVVTGTNLAGLTKVTAGGTSVAFTRLSETQVRVTLPVHAAGTVPIVVTTPGGASLGVGFTYVAPPAPKVTALSTVSGPSSKPTTVTITGTSFGGVTSVLVGTAPVAFVKVSDTQLRVTLPVHAAGAVDLRVVTPGGTSAASAASRFTYVR